MGWNAMAWLGNSDTSKLSNAEFRVLYRLCFRKNDESGKCIPGIETIMQETGMARRPVFSALEGLEEKGWIVRSKRHDPATGRQTSNQYIINGSTEHHFPGGTVKQVGGEVDLRGAPERTPRGAAERTGEGALESTLTKKKELATKATPSSLSRASKTECPDDFWPEPKEGTVTFDKTAAIIDAGGMTGLRVQVERFIAYHQTRGNRYKNWQQCWTTWVTNNVGRNSGNGHAHSDAGREPSNPMVRAGVRREAERLARNGGEGERRAGSGSEHGGRGAQRALGI